MPTSAPAPILGEEVPLREIESGLRRYWADNETSQKASLINLAIWSGAADALERLPAVIEEVSHEHACRAILIAADIDSGHEPQTRAWITAHCHLGTHSKAACSEQIALSFHGRVTGRIRNAVLAHLLSDLPFVLYWEGEFTDFFEPNLLRQVDRLVIDSASWSDPEASWSHLAQVSQANDSLVLHDFAWTRGYMPRTILAARFEDERLQTQLNQAQSLRLRHAPGQRATALAFLAWAATALECQAEGISSSDKGAQIEFKGKSTTLQATLEEGEPGPSLQELEWTLAESSLHLSHETTRWSVTTRHADCETPVQLIPAEDESIATLLASQLARGGKNTLFERCLPILRGLG